MVDSKRTLRALGTRNWDLAQKKVLALETSGDKTRKTIQDATDSYVRDAEARGLRPASVYKFKLLFKQLNAFATDKGFLHIDELDVDALRGFRETWKNKNYSAKKKLENLRTFFRFAYEDGWVHKNHALAIKPPKVEQPPTMPFTRDEFNRVLAACDKYPSEGHPNARLGSRLRALVLLLRYSGLRIADAVTLPRQTIKDDVLILRTEKTGTVVRVPLPSNVIAALGTVARPNGYFFWSGASTKKSCVGDYQRAFKKLYKIAKVEKGHAHRWRDTFAVELLLDKAPIADVSVLLGHQNTKVTEKHYSPWVKERQEQLEQTVRAANERYNHDTQDS